jgi:TIR domain-containing protein
LIPCFTQVILGGAGGFYLLSGFALLFAPNWFFHNFIYNCSIIAAKQPLLYNDNIKIEMLHRIIQEDVMPYELFISYSHQDQALRKELDKHLSNLKRQNIITAWYDGDIAPGTEWQPQIMDHLNTAQIILLLVSADFMASDFCYSIEMTQALARHDAGEARVIPILLRPTDWKGAPFAKLKMLPTGAKAVINWPTHDEGFADVVQGIRAAIDNLTNKGKAANPQ